MIHPMTSSESQDRPSPLIPPPTSAFHIILYNPGKDSLHGKIKYPLDKAEQSFQGLDMQVIQQFIESKLPRNTEIDGSMVQVEKPATAPTAPVPVQANNHLSIQIEALHLLFPAGYGRIYKDKPITLQILLDTRKEAVPSKAFAKVEVIVRKMGTTGTLSLGHQLVKGINSGTIAVLLPSDNLEVASYFLAVYVEVHVPGQNVPQMLWKKKLIHIGAREA